MFIKRVAATENKFLVTCSCVYGTPGSSNVGSLPLRCRHVRCFMTLSRCQKLPLFGCVGRFFSPCPDERAVDGVRYCAVQK